MIDNFDIISQQFNFGETDNLFFHLQILRRGKDHPELPAANKLIKSWLVKSVEQLNNLKREIEFLCEHYKARAYISCAPKSIAKLNTLIMRKLADNLHTGNIINPWNIFNSACGELQGVEKRWVIDVDTKLPQEQFSIATRILRIMGLPYVGSFPFPKIPTLNGCHFITSPFNLAEFKKEFPDVEAKKNGLTALYVPDCIMNNSK